MVFLNRIEKAKALLQEYPIDCLIVDNPIDLFYFTGEQFSLGRLVILEKEVLLFVDGRYFEKAKELQHLSVFLTKGYGNESSFGKESKKFGKRIGFDSTFTSYESYEELAHLKKSLIPLKNPIKKIRQIKEEGEITLLKEAAELGSKGYDHILSLYKEGISESEIGTELEFFWKKSGGEKVAFSPNIAFGANSAFPHHRASSQRLEKGNTILMDIGVVKKNYFSDMTRVVFFKNPFSEMEKIYLIVKEAQSKAFEKCKPGTLIKDVDLAARDWIAKKGYEEFFPHSLGHGVGLEIHEFPSIRSKGEESLNSLQEGMVITIEPGIYLPGIGGVRLEDTIVITKDGFENLTRRPLSSSIPII